MSYTVKYSVALQLLTLVMMSCINELRNFGSVLTTTPSVAVALSWSSSDLQERVMSEERCPERKNSKKKKFELKSF